MKKKSLKELVNLVTFELKYIYIIGFDSFGHRLKACVCKVPKIQEDSDKLLYEYFAYVKSGDNVIFLQETVMDNRFEIIFNPPLILFYAFKEQYVKKLDDLEEEHSKFILGKSLKELRQTYTYNPFLENKDVYPWWYTLADLDKERTEKGVLFGKTEVDPVDRPILKKIFSTDRKVLEKQRGKTMKDRVKHLYTDESLIIDENDKIARKYQK